MKERFLSLLLVMALVSMTMTGCRMGEAMQSMGKTAASSANLVLTPEEAKQIALTHGVRSQCSLNRFATNWRISSLLSN